MRLVAAALLMACTTPSPTPEPAPMPTAPVAAPTPVTPAPAVPVPVPQRLTPEGRYSASHILIDYAGAHASVSTRTEADARTLAESVHSQATAGADFATLSATHSAAPDAQRGGRIGVFFAGTMMPEFEAATAAVEPGEIAALTKTAFGFHIIRRDAVVQGSFRHMVVGIDGTQRRDGTVSSGTERDRAQAERILQTAQTRLAAGESWADVVASVSEDNLAPFAGDLGVVTPGQMVPAFEDAAFALQPGERSAIIETPYGLHIIERY